MSLQEHLHTLLTRLSDTSEILQKWPGGDDPSIHTRTTEKLIESIKRIIDGIKSLEEKVNHVSTDTSTDQSSDSGEDEDIANKLRQIAVPLDLLDMMDFAGGLNPDCFARGLIKEALRQMGNLQRRKASMKMLAATIQNGLDARERQLEILKALDEKLASQGNGSVNRNNDNSETLESDLEKSKDNQDQSTCETNKRKRDESEQPSEEEPPSKR